MKAINANTTKERLAKSYKRAGRMGSLPTKEKVLRQMGAFNRGREWFRLEVR